MPCHPSGRDAGAAGVRRQPGLAAVWAIPPAFSPRGQRIFLLDSALQNNWAAFRGTIRHLILPAGTLALLLSGTFTTALRLNLRRTLRGDYVEAARSRGLSERQVILRHGLPMPCCRCSPSLASPWPP